MRIYAGTAVNLNEFLPRIFEENVEDFISNITENRAEGYNEGLFLLSSYVFLDHEFEWVNLPILIYTCVLLLDIFNGCSLIQ